MRYHCYFADGPVTARLLGVIRDRSAKEIVSLVKNQKFRIFSKMGSLYDIGANNLLLEYISDYVEGTDYTLHDVFYGVNVPVDPGCTSDDELVLSLLNQMPDTALEKLFIYIQEIYPNSFFDFGRDLTPNQRLRTIFSRLPRGALTTGNKSFGFPGSAHLSESTRADIGVYMKNHCNFYHIFDINCMPEYASFVGVSLHWIMNLPVALYCRNQTADNIYDYFTMMQPEDQKELISLMMFYLEEHDLDGNHE